MTPLMPCSTSSISFFPGTAFTLKKHNHLTRGSLSRKSTNHTLSSQRLVLPLPSVTLLPQFRRNYALPHRSLMHIVSATGTDVAVDEPDSPVVNEDTGGASVTSSHAGETVEKSAIKSDTSPAPGQSKRPRPSRKSEMPPVKDEDLVPGATFTGKVRSIQPFGAFVDFGAFTDGLVHVSRLSDSFVKDVGNIVSVGQEVKVRLVEANTETGRISLTMRESDDINKLQQQKDSPATGSSDKPRPARRNTSKPSQKREEVKSSKFTKGQDLEGTVKNLTRSGAFISLPEGEEGFLPTSEEADDGLGTMMGGSTLQIGQEVSVRVLRISRGRVTLTMKKEEDNDKFNMELSQGEVHIATNAFVLAFRKNKDIAAFLDEREKVKKATKEPVIPKTSQEIGPTEAISEDAEVQDQVASSDEGSVRVPSIVGETVEDDETSKELAVGTTIANDVKKPESIESSLSLSVDGSVQTIEKEAEENSKTSVETGPTEAISEAAEVQDQLASSDEGSVSVPSTVGETVEDDETSKELAVRATVASNLKEPEDIESSLSPSVDASVQTIEKEAEENTKFLDPEGSLSTTEQITEEAPSDEGKPDSSGKTASQDLSMESPIGEETILNKPHDIIVKDEVQTQTPIAGNEIPSAAPIEDEGAGASPEENGSIKGSEGVESVENPDPSGAIGEIQALSPETQAVEEVVANLAESTQDEVQIQLPAVETEIPSASQVDDEKVEPTPEKNATIANSNGQSGKSPSKESVTKATISPALVKQLREETGAGMMDCKKALSETGGDIIKAQEFLRKKGLASAEKKASRATAEGRIGSYIHDSRIGVLVEVNCETDFVSRGDIFKELVDDLAMQVAACPQVQYLATEDVSEEIVSKEREIEMQKEDLLSKPEQIRAKIVEGRIRKRLEELALLEQPYIKNDKVVVKDWVKQTIAIIGENVKVKRFVRYNLGEGLEKKSQDFAAEVAAQTTAKTVVAPAKEQPAGAEAKENTQKPPAVAVSASLVKQLREETGAGMMDCKKALSETGGDLEKAQEYLRKKGLSTADKKSSRLAAEGRIGSYIHDTRIGALVEVNSETDFVGRSEKFKELVDDLAMQVVACPQVQFVSIEDIPVGIVNKEKELEMQREDILSKPENIRERIVEGRVSKRLGELALLEQPYIKDDSLLVKDLVKQTVATLGENIKVRRFVRFTLGESSEDKKSETEA